MLKRLFPTLFSPSVTSNFRGDLFGALSAALVGVPGSMAYGLIAVSTLGPEWAGAGALAGLFGSVVAGLITVVLGGNPVKVVGPSAGALLVFAALIGHLLQLPGLGTSEAVAYGCLAVAAAGVIHFALGVARMGRLADFIPYPVIAGFMNGSGLLIMLNQIRPILGLPKADLSWRLVTEITAAHPGTLALAGVTILVMLGVPRFFKSVPPILAGLGVAVLLYQGAAALGAAPFLGDTLQPLPEHLNIGLTGWRDLMAAARHFPTDATTLMVSSTLSMAALLTLDTVFTTLAIDQLTSRRTNPDRELMAQGSANVVAGLLGLLPCAGSMARTRPLTQAGGRTALAAALTAVAIALATVLLAPMVRLLPQAAVAASLAVTGFGILDKWTVGIVRTLTWRRLSHLPRGDILAMAIVVGSTLAFGLMTAVGVGMAVSLLFFVMGMSRSPIRRQYFASALAARVHGDAERLETMKRFGASIVVIELEGALFFGSMVALQRQVDRLIEQGTSHVVLDLKRVHHLDATAVRAIERFHAALHQAGGLIVLAYLYPGLQPGEPLQGEAGQGVPNETRLWQVLSGVGTLDVLDPSQLAPDLDSAVVICERDLARRLSVGPGRSALGLAPPTILRGIDAEAMRRLRRHLSRRRYRAGDRIFRQGDPPDSIYFIAAGRVEVSINLPRTERKLRVQTLARGAIFGEMAVLDPKPRSANVTAIAPSVCYRLSAEEFDRLKRGDAGLAFRLLENTGLIFAERLRVSNLMIAELEV